MVEQCKLSLYLHVVIYFLSLTQSSQSDPNLGNMSKGTELIRKGEKKQATAGGSYPDLPPTEGIMRWTDLYQRQGPQPKET